jgi:hypothetical protein
MHFPGTPSSRNKVHQEVILMLVELLLELMFKPRMADGKYEFGPETSTALQTPELKVKMDNDCVNAS